MTTELLELKIIKGVEPSVYTLGETAAGYDPAPTIIDLLNPAQFVFTLNSNSGVPDYQYGIAGLKNGGVSANSPIADGYSLIATPVDNVTENLTLICDTGDIGGMSAAQSRLAEFIKAIHDFQTSTYQLDPVYIKRRFVGDVAPVYALLVDATAEINAGTPIGDIRQLYLTWIREPYWRAIAPGANPKLYTFQKRGLAYNEDFDVDDLSLSEWQNANANLRSMIEETVANADTRSTVTIVYHNYIDIPAEDIPGDVPALLTVVANPQTGAVPADNLIYIARSTKPDIADSVPTVGTITYNGGDATIGGGLSGTTVTQPITAGAIRCDPPGVNPEDYRIAQIVNGAGAVADQDILEWYTRTFVKNFGRFRVFIRGRVSAGLATNINMRMDIIVGQEAFAGAGGYTIFSASFTPQATAVWSLQDLGNFDMTAIGRQVGISGIALDPYSQFTVRLWTQARAATATATYQLTDIVLLPYDEFSCGTPFSGSSLNGTVLDNTGYMTHGVERDAAFLWVNNTGLPYTVSQLVQGQMPKLEPRKDNRLYFLVGSATDAAYSLNGESARVRINIVPRWRHLRDAL